MKEEGTPDSKEVASILGIYQRDDDKSGAQVLPLSNVNQLAVQADFAGTPIWVKNDEPHSPSSYIYFGDWGWSIGPISERPVAYETLYSKEELPSIGWKLHTSWLFFWV
jgi:hypothetical protein